MATEIERATSIATAVLNAAPTNAQLARVAEACFNRTPVEFDELSNDQKAAALVSFTRAALLDRIRAYEVERAANAAAIIAAQSANDSLPEA